MYKDHWQSSFDLSLNLFSLHHLFFHLSKWFLCVTEAINFAKDVYTGVENVFDQKRVEKNNLTIKTSCENTIESQNKLR